MKKVVLTLLIFLLASPVFALFCQECGKGMPDDAKFCSQCGQKKTDAKPVAVEASSASSASSAPSAPSVPSVPSFLSVSSEIYEPLNKMELMLTMSRHVLGVAKAQEYRPKVKECLKKAESKLSGSDLVGKKMHALQIRR